VLPVFPLAGVILLERMPLPLNIYEPRYLAMIDWVLSSERLLGIIQPKGAVDLEQGQSPRGKETGLQDIGTVGRLTAFQETDDGRYGISLTGICRFRVQAELPSQQEFRVAEVDYTPFANDLRDNDDAGTGAIDRERFLSVLKAYLKAKDMTADWSAIKGTSDAVLVNSLAMNGPHNIQEKQALLEASSLSERAEILIALAEMEMAGGGSGNGGSGAGSALQ